MMTRERRKAFWQMTAITFMIGLGYHMAVNANLIHELGHAVAMIIEGGRVEAIGLSRTVGHPLNDFVYYAGHATELIVRTTLLLAIIRFRAAVLPIGWISGRLLGGWARYWLSMDREAIGSTLDTMHLAWGLVFAGIIVVLASQWLEYWQDKDIDRVATRVDTKLHKGVE